MTDLQRCEMEQQLAASYLTDPAKCAAWAAEYHCEVETARRGALLSAWDWLMEEAILRLEGQASSLGIEQFGSDPQSARCRNSESSVSESSVDSAHPHVSPVLIHTSRCVTPERLSARGSADTPTSPCDQLLAARLACAIGGRPAQAGSRPETFHSNIVASNKSGV